MGGIMACCKMWYELPGCLIFPQPNEKQYLVILTVLAFT